MSFTKEFKFTVEYRNEAHAAVCAEHSDGCVARVAATAQELATNTGKKDGWHDDWLWIGYKDIGCVWRKSASYWSDMLPGWYGRVGKENNGPHKLKGDAKKWVESQVAAKAGE